MQINYADEAIDMLTLLGASSVAILDKEDEALAEWLEDSSQCISCFIVGKYRTTDVVFEDIDFLQVAKNIKNKLLESKEYYD